MTTDPTTSPSPEPQDVREAYDAFLKREKLHATTPGSNMWKAFKAGRLSALAQSDADLFDKLRIRHLLDEWFAGPNPTNVDALADVLRLRLARAADRSALAQSDAEPAADAGLIEAAEWLSTAASRFEEAADALRSEYKTYARQMDRWAGDTRERARLFRIFSCAADRCEHQWIDARNEHVKSGEVCLKCGAIRAADRSVHGEPIPDCPTDGVAARQGNGG